MKARSFAGALLWVLPVVVAVVITVFDVFCIAYLMRVHWGLPYDISMLLSAVAMVLYLTVFELAVWVVYKAVTALYHRHKSRQGVSNPMSQSQLSDLLSQMNTLQADSLEARKTLIRESFEAMSYDVMGIGAMGRGDSNGHSKHSNPDNTPIEPDFYECN